LHQPPAVIGFCAGQFFYPFVSRRITVSMTDQNATPEFVNKAYPPAGHENIGLALKQVWPPICQHDGPCKEAEFCQCVRNKTACRPGCSCEDCPISFPPCNCGSSCDEHCRCIEFGRECQPGCSDGRCSDKCWNVKENWKVPKIEVKESLIPNAGMGLFAKHHIKVGSVIGIYKGKLVKEDRSQNDGVVKLFEIAKSKSMARDPSSC
jgi:hypothetical protein